MPDALEALLGILPAILLAISLVFGCYPGEEIIVRLANRARPRRRRTAAPSLCRQRPAAGIREALLLLAASRPLRGPPRLSLAQP